MATRDVAGQDRRPVVAPLPDQLAGIEPQAGLLLKRAVATVAPLLEERLDVTGIVARHFSRLEQAERHGRQKRDDQAASHPRPRSDAPIGGNKTTTGEGVAAVSRNIPQ